MEISSRKFENFELFCPLGAMKLGVQQKKLLHLIQTSQDPTYIYFSPYIHKFHGHFWLKFNRVLSMMLLNFCGDRVRGLGSRTKLKKTFKKQSFRYLSKIKFGQKKFSPTPPPFLKNKKKVSTHFLQIFYSL